MDGVRRAVPGADRVAVLGRDVTAAPVAAQYARRLHPPVHLLVSRMRLKPPGCPRSRSSAAAKRAKAHTAPMKMIRAPAVSTSPTSMPIASRSPDSGISSMDTETLMPSDYPNPDPASRPWPNVPRRAHRWHPQAPARGHRCRSAAHCPVTVVPVQHVGWCPVRGAIGDVVLRARREGGARSSLRAGSIRHRAEVTGRSRPGPSCP